MGSLRYVSIPAVIAGTLILSVCVVSCTEPAAPSAAISPLARVADPGVSPFALPEQQFGPGLSVQGLLNGPWPLVFWILVGFGVSWCAAAAILRTSAPSK